ncbi:hypothetical protein ACOMHN_017350 [Nucella lapillus]
MAGCVPLPKLTEGYLGKQSKFDEYQLTTLSHSDPVIYMAEDQSEVEIIIGTEPDRPTRITTKLLSHDRKKECNEFALLRCLGPSYCFLIRPPTPGFYKFQIYALPHDEAGPNFIGVINYVIYCPHVPQNVVPLPKQYPMWKDGCYLTEPVGIPKGCQEPQLPFRLNIPNAKDVQIKVGEDWNPLPMTEAGIFEGPVDLSNNYPPGTKVKVNVKGQGNKYNTYLEYTL